MHSFMAGAAIPLPNTSRLLPSGLEVPLTSSSVSVRKVGAATRASTRLPALRIAHPHHYHHDHGVFGAHNLSKKSTTSAATKLSNGSSNAASADSAESSNGMPNAASPNTRSNEESRHPFSHLHVGKRWRKIQGEENWKGLMDPIDPVLRGEVVRYGEFSQAIYDAFDYDEHSRFCGSCKYNKKKLFHKLGLENLGYEVTDYIYGSAAGVQSSFMKLFRPTDSNDEIDDIWDLESNWMGFVAVTTDPEEIKRLGRRDIVIAWRGTVTKLEWLHNLQDYLSPAGLDPRRAGQNQAVDLKVEAGFLHLYKEANPRSLYAKTSARRQVLQAITRLVRKYGDERLSITVTGHSLGSALAMLAAYDIAETGVNQASMLPDSIETWDHPDADRDPDKVVEYTRSDGVKTIPVTVFSFGGPRVGNDAFRDRMEELGVRTLRLVNVHDVVPRFPGLIFNERFGFLENWLGPFWRWLDSLPWTYTHVGVALFVDNLTSPYLKKTKDPNHAHNLEGYMHVVSGFQGKGKPFVLQIARDLALVNKEADFLPKALSIPPSWRQEENKGMVRAPDGRWMPRVRDLEDFPERDLEDNQDDTLDPDTGLPQPLSTVAQ